MSTTNYNSTNVGVPYVRCNNIQLQYPENGIPHVTIDQALAVKLADGTVREIQQLQSLSFVLDMANNATTPIPLIDPTSGASLGSSTNLQQLMLGILAAIRVQQLQQNP